MSDTLVPLFGIIFLFGAPVAAWIVSRVLAHQERMEMIRRGIVPPADPRLFRDMQRRGWQAGPIPPPPGPGLGAVPPPNPPGAYDDVYYAQSQMRKGVTVTMVGFALLIGLSFIGYHSDGRIDFGPWLLGGLIPMFVGIAQIINALLNGARFPGVQPSVAPPPQSPFNAQQQAPGAGVPPNPPPAGPYGWRPGPTPEIEKPAQPPDAR